jgi:Subtilase family
MPAAAMVVGLVAGTLAIAPPGITAAAGRSGPGPLTWRLATLASGRLRGKSASEQAAALSLPSSGGGSLLRSGDRILVDVAFSSGAASHVRDLRAAGARVVFASSRYQTVTVAVTPGRLRSVAAVPGVRVVQEDLSPMVGGVRASASTLNCHGSVDSEGDTQLHAANARTSFGVDGSGVTVGVLSDSYDRHASAATHASDDVASGDLPGTGGTCGTAPVKVLDDSFVGADEGRAMLQIVHDLAPGASLAFATASKGETSFAHNIRALRNAGADVIVDDVSYLDEPFFQDGPVSVAVNDVTAGGAAYYSSAANNNLVVGGHDAGSYEAPAFRNAGSCPAALAPKTQCLDFAPGTGIDTTYGLSVANGATVKIDLQWAQPWFGVTTDLDAFLLNHAGTAVLAHSNNRNTGSSGTQKPFEFLAWKNQTGSPQLVSLVIDRFTGAGGGDQGTPRVKLVLDENGAPGVVPTQYTTSNGGDVVGPEIFGHNGAASAMTVAAVPYNNSSTVEPFSSRGPVTLYYGPVTGTVPARVIAPRIVPKPDISATDDGVTTFFAYFDGTNWRFPGTSAAAPHAAAVAALELALNPSADFAAIRASQMSTASTVDSFPHAAVGAGLLNALKAAGAVSGLVTLDPSTIAFGPTAPGSTSPPATITLHNGTSGTLHVSSVALGNGSPFTITQDGCTGHALAPAGTCQVDVEAQPPPGTALGSTLRDDLTFSDDWAPLPQEAARLSVYVADVSPSGAWFTERTPGSETGNEQPLGIACVPSGSSGRCWAVGLRYNGTHPNFGTVYVNSGGYTWARQVVPAGVGQLSYVSCVSVLRCWATGYTRDTPLRPAIIATTNGGVTWVRQHLPAGAGYVGQISCVSASRCWSAASGGALAATTNGGATWFLEHVHSPTGSPGVFDVSFVDGTTGKAVGFISGGCGGTTCTGVIWGTTDGGHTWRIERKGVGFPALQTITCVDARRCWAAGHNANSEAVWATTDGGSTWKPEQTPFIQGAVLYDLACVGTKPARCWAVGTTNSVDRGVILRTVDGGATWVRQQPPKSVVVVQQIQEVGPQLGWAIEGSDQFNDPIIATRTGGLAP